MENANTNLVEITGLKKYFPVKEGFLKSNFVKAVDDVTLHIKKGETLGLVGESGCGKTTLGRTILRLHEPTEGKIIYDGEDITNVNMHSYRRRMQIIFQDPYASLDPRMTVGDIIGEPLDIHKLYKNRQERQEKIYGLLETVGLNKEHANRFPHEFSGGQRQRIGIARALAVEPEFIVCDEPISALDVSIQAQIVNMLEDLQKERGFTYLFIAHDLSVVKHISNRIGVMYLGHLVELTSSNELYKNPMHPYTKTLLSAIPIADPKSSRERKRIVLKGDIPSPLNPPSGCTFRTRCPHATDECKNLAPILKEYDKGHFVACHNIGKI
ncbi:MAG: dipeptide ABC transporter ATP-binding protein [Terrisporobacter othiniensis]|uniref:ABC transporter ATP-binding protein n=1 Tax=Terrisporobacter othiniensis TaxID=1577792 RepID=UPI002912E551|nr:dipeptide ABC transporter ATP-binding protein [Terrisporobacter othiniensis]MDU6983580.1 dipeptide ABC transporter ATP-binding protein [Terrisporobacter othiniensis]